MSAFRSREVAGPVAMRRPGSPSSSSKVTVAAIGWKPVTGKKHQLRLHLAALGAPIENDAFHPEG